MRIRLVIIAVIFALVGGTFALRVGRSAPRVEGGPAQAVPISVAVATAQRADFITSVSATGTVASIREAKIASTLPGIVAEVFVTEGQRVQRGTPLLQLKNDQMAASEAQARAGVASARATLAKLTNGARPEELRQAAAAAAQTKAALDLARTNLERMRSLYEMGAVSQQNLDGAESQFRQSQAANDVARDSLRLAQLGPRGEDIAAVRAQLDHAEAALVSAQIQFRDSTVTAPFAGTITRRLVEPGEAVSPASPAFILAQLDSVYAELAVPEREQTSLRTGQAVAITVDALPGAQFAGTIAEIQPTATVSSRSFIVKVRVRNAQGVLRPGMFARGTITIAVRPNVLQVPDTAVLATSGKPIVFVVQDGRASRREVTLGERQNGRVEITGGLTGGEQVVVSGAAGVTDAQSVTVRTSP
jgi:multidrug efflux pump subunit AcrA (membrane-fusion protein)